MCALVTLHGVPNGAILWGGSVLDRHCAKGVGSFVEVRCGSELNLSGAKCKRAVCYMGQHYSRQNGHGL